MGLKAGFEKAGLPERKKAVRLLCVGGMCCGVTKAKTDALSIKERAIMKKLNLTYEDGDPKSSRKTYWYKLEDVDYSGTTVLHGPVKATPRLVYGVFQ